MSLNLGAATLSEPFEPIEEPRGLVNHWTSIYNGGGTSLAPSLQNMALAISAIYLSTSILPLLLGTFALVNAEPILPFEGIPDDDHAGVVERQTDGPADLFQLGAGASLLPSISNILLVGSVYWFGTLGLPLLLASLGMVNAEPTPAFDGILGDVQAQALQDRQTDGPADLFQLGGGASLMPSIQNLLLAISAIYFGTLGLPLLLTNLAFANAEPILPFGDLESRQTDGPINLFQLGGSTSLLPSLQTILLTFSAAYFGLPLLLTNLAFANAEPLPVAPAPELENRQDGSDGTPLWVPNGAGRAMSPFSPPLFAAAVIAGGVMCPRVKNLVGWGVGVVVGTAVLCFA